MSDLVSYTDIDGKVVETNWFQVNESIGRIQNFFKALNERFVERKGVFKAIMYAMLMREHVLIYGAPGTAKTDIADSVIKAIKDAKTWSDDLNKFTSDTHLFGSYDLKEARKSGKLTHLTEGSLLEANYANVGEFLDANPATLRAALRVFNEREFTRGSQKMKVPLLSVFANTNFDPAKRSKQNEDLQAVLDRFLFWEHVSYVKDKDNRIKMLNRYQQRDTRAPLPELSLQDIVLVSGIIRHENLLKDGYVVSAYEEAARVFGERKVKEGLLPISDRRFLKASNAIEASALLNGRKVASLDDIAAAGHVLAEDEKQYAWFQEEVTKITEAVKVKQANSEREKEKEALDKLLADVKAIPRDTTGLDANAIMALRRQIKTVKTLLDQFQASSYETRNPRDEARDDLEKFDGSLTELLIKIV